MRVCVCVGGGKAARCVVSVMCLTPDSGSLCRRAGTLWPRTSTRVRGAKDACARARAPMREGAGESDSEEEGPKIPAVAAAAGSSVKNVAAKKRT